MSGADRGRWRERDEMALIEFEVRDKLAFITLNRPEKMNAINEEMVELMFEILAEVSRDKGVRACILTGNGKAFSSGHDLTYFAGERTQEARPVSDLYQVILELPRPCFAAINGICLAGGAGIALSTDIRLMAEGARLGWPQVKRGVSSVSGPFLLANLVPRNIAYEILFTGEFLSAERALELGLVNRVVPEGSDILEETEALARQVMKNAPLAIQAIKDFTVRARHLSSSDALRMGDLLFKKFVDSEDGQEGLAAFLEKREPNWKNK
ncbi:MAG TPA: enoyl-CoA hydratase [Nitrospinae bacterium]|nr:enoyl-CoA hydratase [Nitrospinota bacterium]